MQEFWSSDFMILILASFVSVSMALILVILLSRRASRRDADARARAASAMNDPVAYLFLNGSLAEATLPGRSLIETVSEDLEDWERLHTLFATRFPDVPRDLPDTLEYSRVALHSDDHGMLDIAARDGVVRVRLTEAPDVSTADRHLLRIRTIEDRRMRDSFALAPFPIWVTDQNHVVLWANDRYRALQISAGRDSDFCVLDTGLALPQNDAPVAVRVKMEPNANDQGSASWFNVVVRRMPNFWLYYATDVSEVVKAEKAQLSFVQTLTKTFAALDTGFAIFDHERRLTMFNPALVALTRINPEVLSARPTLSAFLDSLRDANMVPEPKDYKSWRKRLSSLASDDDKRTGYEETWSLADGTTFRVTGWPYPNGAVAFLFKDITDEVTAIHRLHSALSIGQSALDCFDEAICIISRQGKLLLANADYHALFGSDPAHVREISILQILRDWEKTLKPGPIGRAMTDSGGSFPTRQDFVSREETRDGRTLTCRVSPLMAGATLCRFSAEPEIALMKAP